MPAVQETIDTVKAIDVDQYKYGFVTDIESEKGAKGLSEETVRFLSAKKNEPEWMTEWRLDALRRFQQMEEPTWARVSYPKIDLDDLYYWASPKSVEGPKSLVFRCASRKSWPVSSRRTGLRSMLCSIPFPS